MANFTDLSGPIVANTLYVDDVLVGRDISATLPDIEFMTATVQARGEWEIPIQTLFSAIELAITRVGMAENGGKLMETGMRRIELRNVQSKTGVDGTSGNQSIKVFATGLSKTLPGGDIAIGEAIEQEFTYSLKRYQVFVDGVELLCIDRTGPCRINGKDITSGVESLL